MPLYNYIVETGVIVPDTSELQGDVQTEYQAAIGADLVVIPQTPQGVMIVAETISRDAVVRNNAALANQINPNLAGGVFLDAICALTGLQRTMGTPSVIAGVSLTGVPSTVIPQGSQASTVDGDIFATANGVVLDGSGLATVDFIAVELGPIQALSGTLTQIVSGVLGWETVTNINSATLGTSEQSDQNLRALRRNTLALQGVALPEAITSALNDTTGVKSLSFRENVTSITKDIDGVTMQPHSIYTCVDGGSDQDVANALLANKSLGCAWNGNTTVNVIEPASGQSYPVQFSRPDEIAILVRATIKVDSTIINPATTVQQAILDYANGLLEGENGFGVGDSVSSFELAGAVNREAPGIYVQKMEITKATSISFSSNEIPIAIFEVARIQASSISVIIA